MLHIYQLSFLPPSSVTSRIFMIFSTTAQCAVEVVVIALLHRLLVKSKRPLLISTYIFLTFFLLLVQIIDFTVLRIFDMTVWHAMYSYLFLETFENFILLLYASDISISKWIAFGLIALTLPIITVWIYRLTHHISSQKPLQVRTHRLGYMLLLTLPALVVWDLVIASLSDFSLYDDYRKVTPWKKTIFQPEKQVIALPGVLTTPPNENEAKSAIEALNKISLEKRPNIFFLVAESLRNDFITPEVTPYLHAFKQNYLSSDCSLACGNCTQTGWYSLFHCQNPLFWGQEKTNSWSIGSPTLALLKEKGYKIHVYTATRLSYYNMDELLFGKERHLLDDFHFYPYADEVKPWQSDLAVTEKICEDLSSYEDEGHVFIAFFDSTHFHYSWPESTTQFTPYCEKINYLQAICQKKGVDEIKNRYRNAFHYVDHLFGKIQLALMEKGSWKDAVVMLCGDHGDSLLEKKSLFHASELFQEQTETVLLCKFGDHQSLPAEADLTMISQVDLFPSLLHFLFGKEVLEKIHSGESIFSSDRSHFAITARYNCAAPANEFFLHNGKEKILLRYLDQQKEKLLLLSHKTANDHDLQIEVGSIEETFKTGLKKITISPLQ